MREYPTQKAMPPIKPICLAIHVTYQCPLTCDHCCFSSTMQLRGHLSAEEVVRLIDEAARLEDLEIVGFTGGDPFLHVDVLEAGIRAASRHGLKSRIVTSGYWASNDRTAREKLGSLVAAGLTQLHLSYDDSHAKYLAEDRIRRAYDAAEEFGIDTAIYMSCEPGDRIDEAYVRALLGLRPGEENPRLTFVVSNVTTTGRAAETASEDLLAQRAAKESTYLGPCPSVLRQPAVTPSGKMMACCGTIPFRPGLSTGTTRTDSVDGAFAASFDDPVFQWLAFEGPAAILRQITADTDAPLTDADFDGICHACDMLFSSPAHIAQMRNLLSRKRPALEVQRALYEATGHMRTPVARLVPVDR